jgi:hypothetical protein
MSAEHSYVVLKNRRTTRSEGVEVLRSEEDGRRARRRRGSSHQDDGCQEERGAR